MGRPKGTQSKVLQRKHLAYSTRAEVRLPVGTRVIAKFKEHGASNLTEEEYYSGIIAEPPKVMNRYRYLIFFDDGYTSYLTHNEIRLISHQSKEGKIKH